MRRVIRDGCCSCRGEVRGFGEGDVNVDVDGGAKDNGEGFFFTGGVVNITGCFSILGFMGMRPIAVRGLTTPPPNFAIASLTDGKSILDPNVGVPHLELARSVAHFSPFATILSSSLTTLLWLTALGTSKNADPLPARARLCIGIATGTATMCPNNDPVALVTFTTFHPAESARATVSRSVRSWALNIICI